MPLKRKRLAKDASPDPPSPFTSDPSSFASSNDAGADQDAVPTADAPPATSDLDEVISVYSDRRVTNRTKTLVRLREHQKCWLCGFHGVHIAHVVARADAILLSSYIEQGLLPPDFGFHGLPNLMLLCAGCHHNFDVRIPVWAFLPSDLQSFVDRELEFHRLRDIAAASGIGLQREHRPNEEISYTRYLVRQDFISPAPFQHTPQKPWAGDPIATILRSQSIISGHRRVSVDQGGIPVSTMDTLYQLLSLYATPPPIPVIPAVPVDAPHRGRVKSKLAVRATSKSHRPRPRPRTRPSPTPPSITSADVSPNHGSGRRHRWTLGPAYSSNDAIRYVCGGSSEVGPPHAGAVRRPGRKDGVSP